MNSGDCSPPSGTLCVDQIMIHDLYSNSGLSSRNQRNISANFARFQLRQHRTKRHMVA